MKSISKYLTLLPEHRNIRRQQASYKNPEHFCSSEPAFHSSFSELTSRPRAAVTRVGHTAGTNQCCPTNLKLIPPMVDEFNCRADFQAWLAQPSYQRHWKAKSTGAPPGSALSAISGTWPFLEGEKTACGWQPLTQQLMPPTRLCQVAISLAPR